MLHSLPVQILTNFLAYFSNSNYKDSTIYVVKYMKYLEQSISQATRFCGGLGHWSTNIFPFLFCLWTLAMGRTLTNRLIEKKGKRGLKCTCVVGFALFHVCLYHEKRMKSMPQETHWSQKNEK